MDDWQPLPFDEEPAGDRPPFSVSELTAHLKALIGGAFGVVSVEGEISNCRSYGSGHTYFTLKDDRAQLRAALFKTQARRVKFRLEDGMHVVAHGRLDLYEVKGEYQLIVDTIEPHGLGALQAAFEQLKRRLQAEGLFESARKRPLPVLPRRIGIVTSADGAALRDILRVLIGRHPTARVVIGPARVQGDEAPGELVRALAAVARVPEIDVIIIGRGGGSAEDLWAFNDERLARAIAACPVPVIAGVGHETDFTIADFVADVRAATPSNAAELVIDRADNFAARIRRADASLRQSALRRIGASAQRAERLAFRLDRWPMTVAMRDRDRQDLDRRLAHAVRDQWSAAAQRFDALRRRLEERDVRRVAAELGARVLRAEGALRTAIALRYHRADAGARELVARLHALSPLAVLGRGYAVCWNEARTSIIRSAATVAPGDRVRVTLAEGELGCRVEERGTSR